MAVVYDEETIYYRKLLALLRELPALARYDHKVVAAGTLEEALKTKFSSLALMLHDFEPEAVDSHNTIRDWYFRCYLTVIIKRKTAPSKPGELPNIIAGEIDGAASIAVIDGILNETFRQEYLGGHVNLINFRLEETNPVISGIEETNVESRSYFIEGIKEVNL